MRGNKTENEPTALFWPVQLAVATGRPAERFLTSDPFV